MEPVLPGGQAVPTQFGRTSSNPPGVGLTAEVSGGDDPATRPLLGNAPLLATLA